MTVSTTSPGSPSPMSPLISMPEIAELAGVRRPVVTTWRRRHKDFPAPVAGDAGRPLFDGHQVAGWLLRTGRGEAEQVSTELSLHTLAALSPLLPARQLIAAVTALICLRHLGDDEPLADGTDDVMAATRSRAAVADPDDEFLASEITQLPPRLHTLPAQVDELVEAAWGCAGAFERVMRERSRFSAADLLVTAVTPALARLMAELSGARELAQMDQSLVISDLSAGPGDLLTAVAEMLGADHSPMFTGAESDDYLARLTRRRLLVHGIPAIDLDIRAGAQLPDEAGEPDAIITQIPYAPGEERSAADVLEKLDDVSLRLAPGRTAVVLGPADVLVAELTAYSPAERRRSELVKGGMVEAIIQLPGGLLPFRPGYQPALWVITSSFSSPWAGRILLADVSDRPLTDDVVEGLAADVVTWRRDGYEPRAHARQFGTEELISELIEPPGSLTPRRPRGTHAVTTSGHARVARVAELQADLAAATTTKQTSLNSEIAAGSLQAPERTTIGKLVARRRLAMIKGTRLNDDDVSADGHYVVISPEEVLGHRRLGAMMIDRSTLATSYRQARLTEPGDVIVTTSPVLAAIVDDAGFSVVSFPARAIRIPPTERAHFTPRVLAALLAASLSGGRPAGAVRASYRLEDQPVPLLAPDDLLRLDELLARLYERTTRARQEIDALTELSKIATAGLADGTLTFTGDMPEDRYDGITDGT